MKVSTASISRQRVRRNGLLAFEWILIITLVAIGIVSGLSAARDAITDELADVAEATLHIDQSFSVSGNAILGTPNVQFIDQPGAFARRRGVGAGGQGAVSDEGKSSSGGKGGSP